MCVEKSHVFEHKQVWKQVISFDQQLKDIKEI